MVGGSNTKLNLSWGIEKSTDASLSEILLDNFINFYDWGLLDAGSFYTISIPQSDIYGGNRHKLRLVNEPNYTAGQVWEGYRQNWVWEGNGNIDGVSEQPLDITGVYVDGVFYANGNVTKPFYIDYPLGRVVFDSAESTTSDVQIAYSHKRVQVLPGKGDSWFRQIQQNSFRTDQNFQVAGSGGWIRLGQTRVQLPALAVEVVPARETEGFQLGGGKWIRSDLVFYVMAENHWEALNLVDTIVSQDERTLTLYDTTKVAQSGVSPFTFENGKERELRGHATASGLYPQLVENYPFKKCWIYDSKGDNVTQLATDLYIGIARCKTEVGPV